MPQDIESMELVVPTPISDLQRTTVGPQEKLHLALFISGLSVGGVERTMLALAHGLAERGHRVDLLVLKASGFFEQAVSPLVNLVNLVCRLLR